MCFFLFTALRRIDTAVDAVLRPSYFRTIECCAPICTDELIKVPKIRSTSNPFPTYTTSVAIEHTG